MASKADTPRWMMHGITADGVEEYLYSMLPPRDPVLAEMEASFGEMRRLPGSNSMFVVGDEAARVYFRYSKLHGRGQAFFGL